MDFNTFMENYANEIGGQYQEYDTNKSVVIFPLGSNRYQAVLGTKKNSEITNMPSIEFTSKVCPYTPSINLESLVRANATFTATRFVLLDDFIRVEAATYLANATENGLKSIIEEVAIVADAWEHKLTGQDVH
ncbi:hypothetical protein GCM10011506_14530 [Marivirga lumbricoides]|uniref:Uncharacterized protein n=1 Tax=Marivirga lumbricoides TaxID=1046115 RepID=A0A2T4DUI1_9BACT|nr:hypothetical protein C9994_02825 [Marivirga lumbricoides]GGC30215.1 hypothetical protein GCM10011506_14530 [Marivirga lumbricoides]